MTFKPLDVLVIPFPFVDSSKSKPRPIVVLTSNHFNNENGHCVAAMITTASQSNWVGDIEIKNLSEAGLNHRSFVRLKLFTLDIRINPKKIGHLFEEDGANLFASIKKNIPAFG